MKQEEMGGKLSPDGEFILAVLTVCYGHLKSHHCAQCIKNYESILKAITAWVRAEAKEEGLHGEQGKNGEGKAEKDDPLAIFD